MSSVRLFHEEMDPSQSRPIWSLGPLELLTLYDCCNHLILQETEDRDQKKGCALRRPSRLVEQQENLKMFINVNHQNIITASPHLTETSLKHHGHRAETSPTQNLGSTHISPKRHNTITTHHQDITETRPRHHQHIT